MKNCIKLLFVILLISVTTNSYSQTFGVKAGLNLSKMLWKNDRGNYTDYLKMKPGFHFGATAEFPIDEIFSFEPGLLFSTKGYKWALGGDINLTLYYFDLPLNLKAVYYIKQAKIYGTFGPYLGIGLSGKTEYDLIINGKPESGNEDIKWGTSEDDSFKRFDFGLNFGTGIEIKSILLGVSYELGLANIEANPIDGSRLSNQVISISVGYKFHKK
jgi:hypothetical protein